MNEMSYCREALRRLSGDGPVMVKLLTAWKQHEDSKKTAWKQHEDSGHTEPAYNAGLMDGGQYRDGRGVIPPQTEQRKRRLTDGTINKIKRRMLSGKINEAL